MFQTNITPQRAIRNDPQGVEKLRDFIKFAITKGKMEFIEDLEVPASFVKCVLSKTRIERKGLGFKLIDMENVGWTNYFTTEVLEFRQIS